MPARPRPRSLGRAAVFVLLLLFMTWGVLELALQAGAWLVVERGEAPPVPSDLDARDPTQPLLLGIGDSWMQGAPGPAEEAYISRIQDRFRGAGQPVVAVNRGAWGTNSAQATLEAEAWIPRLGPDIVYVTTGFNDHHNVTSTWEVDARLGDPTIVPSPFLKLRTVRAARIIFESLRGPGPGSEVVSGSSGAAPTWALDWSEGRLVGRLNSPGASAEAWWPIALYSAGRDEAAADAAWETIRAAPIPEVVPEAILAAGLLDLRSGRFGKGRVVLSQLVDSPDGWVRDLGLGLWGLTQTNHDVAKALLARTLRETPLLPEARWGMSMVHADQITPKLRQAVAQLPDVGPVSLYSAGAEPTIARFDGLHPVDRFSDLLSLHDRLPGDPRSAIDGALRLAGDTSRPVALRGRAAMLALDLHGDLDGPQADQLETIVRGPLADQPAPRLLLARTASVGGSSCEQLRIDYSAIVRSGESASVLKDLQDQPCALQDGELSELRDQLGWSQVEGLSEVDPDRIRATVGLGKAAIPPDRAILRQRYRTRMDRILALTEAHGSQLIVVGYALQNPLHAESNRWASAWARDREVLFVDCETRFAERLEATEWESMEASGLHLNASGYELMSEIIFEAQAARGLPWAAAP